MRPVCATLRGARRLRRGGGFTLVELIAVLVIVGVLAAAAVPALSHIPDARAAIAARDLLGDLSYARQRAVATGTRAWVVFDTGGQTWSVLSEDPDSPGRAGAVVLPHPAGKGDYSRTLNADVFVEVRLVSVNFDDAAEVGFDWLGRPLNDAETPLAADGSVTITGGHQITVAAVTGHMNQSGP